MFLMGFFSGIVIGFILFLATFNQLCTLIGNIASLKRKEIMDMLKAMEEREN